MKKISGKNIAFYFLCISVFLIAFEQITLLYMGFDTVWKPYRIIIILTVAMAALFGLALHRKTRHLLYLFSVILLVGFIIFFAKSITNSVSDGQAIHHFLLFIFAFSFYIVIQKTINTPNQIIILLYCIIISSLISTAMIFALKGDASFYRFSGFFRNPNHYAYLISISILICLYLVTRSVGKPLLSVTLLCAFFIGVLFLVLSGSRGALATAVVALSIFLCRYISLPGRNQGARVATVLGLLAIAAAIMPYVLSSDLISLRLLDRFAVEQLSTGSGRFDIWRAGLLAAEDSFYLGIGLGQYTEVHQEYIVQVGGAVYSTVLDFELGLHSEYMSLIVEFGIISFTIYLIAMYIIWRGILKFRKLRPEWAHLATFLESLFVFNILFSATQTMYYFPYSWVVLGICASVIQMRWGEEPSVAQRRSTKIKPVYGFGVRGSP